QSWRMLGKDNGALVIIVATVLTVRGCGGYQLPSGTHKLCGPALSDAMAAVCDQGYNTMTPKKDAEDKEGSGVMLVSGSRYSLSPLLSSLFGSEVLIKTRRLRRHYPGGIYDECCLNSCSYQELADYCLRLPQ
ncbi:hypothetical protein KR067_013102, partial [Drosophila pandora]